MNPYYYNPFKKRELKLINARSFALIYCIFQRIVRGGRSILLHLLKKTSFLIFEAESFYYNYVKMTSFTLKGNFASFKIKLKQFEAFHKLHYCILIFRNRVKCQVFTQSMNDIIQFLSNSYKAIAIKGLVTFVKVRQLAYDLIIEN